MNPNDVNVLLLEVVARQLGDALLDELVFVGGAVAGLLITDPAMPAIRPTEDVDLLVQSLTLADYHRVEKQLVARGFVHDMSPDAPVCRWLADGIKVDVMPACLVRRPLSMPSPDICRAMPAARRGRIS